MDANLQGTRHMYYFDPKVIDLAKLREQAKALVVGDYRNAPVQSVTIHHHRRDDSCGGKKHEEFTNE